ncbi:MAG: hypothetical protein AB1Z55_05310 [Acidimicrobiia bacterium]
MQSAVWQDGAMAESEHFLPEPQPFPFGNTGRLVAGGGLTLVGVAGLALPVLPGWAFIVPGLGIMAPAVPILRPIHLRILRQYRTWIGEYGPHPEEAHHPDEPHPLERRRRR